MLSAYDVRLRERHSLPDWHERDFERDVDKLDDVCGKEYCICICICICQYDRVAIGRGDSIAESVCFVQRIYVPSMCVISIRAIGLIS